ncbi:MAG: hypothetical protein Q8N31_10240 [Reyranella sp.]|nr:hypothetical protein [Reyranella sp.]MDP3160385.1 hypothetical protein [Reyranella sp.]
MISQLRRLFQRPPKPGTEEPKLCFIPAIAEALLQQGQEMWAANPHDIAEAIVKVEKSWALQPCPEAAIQLGVMYDRVNRHQDSLAIYRQAFRANPNHARLRHEAGITLLRHGTPHDTRNFFDSIRRLDPDDEFARFYFMLSDNFDDWKLSLATKVARPDSGPAPYLIVCPVWGAEFAENFVELYCAALLAPGNLPALAKEHPVHFVVFCPADIQEALNGDPRFQPILSYARVHFVNYADDLTDYSSRMDNHYGKELGLYYRRTCKFLLMSTAHYVTLGVARSVDGYVIPLGADVLLSDGSLGKISRIMRSGADVVLVTGIRLGEEVREILEKHYRQSDGSLPISEAETAELYVHHMLDNFFVHSEHFTSMPIYLCWKVGSTGVLAHSTHYHPTCIRASASTHPYEISIDPVDSRFMDRAGFPSNRLHFIQDTSISVFAVEADPLMGHDRNSSNIMTPKDVGLWLSGLWGDIRATYLRIPIRFSAKPPSGEWEKAEAEALIVVEEILSTSMALESRNTPRKSWRLPAI